MFKEAKLKYFYLSDIQNFTLHVYLESMKTDHLLLLVLLHFVKVYEGDKFFQNHLREEKVPFDLDLD